MLITPSWVIPGTYAENIRFLEDKREIAGVELLFFIYNDETRAQLDSDWEEIYRRRERFVFTAHLPENLRSGHEELIARLAPLVRHFIVHPAAENPEAQAKLLAEWEERYGARSKDGSGRGPLFLAENTFPGLLEGLLPHLGAEAGLCMDTGHLLLEGKNPADFFAVHCGRIGEIHLHGLDHEAALRDGRLAITEDCGGMKPG